MKQFIARVFCFVLRHEISLVYISGIALIIFSQRGINNDNPFSFWIGITLCVLSFQALAKENQNLSKTIQGNVEKNKQDAFVDNTLRISLAEMRELKEIFKEADPQEISIEPLLYEDPNALSQSYSEISRQAHSKQTPKSAWDPEPLHKDSYENLPATFKFGKDSSDNNDP